MEIIYMNITTIALAPFQLEHELARELTYRGIKFTKHDRLFFYDTNYQPIFSQVVWFDCQKMVISSINDGIKKLRAIAKNWALFSIGNHRRAGLIQDGLAPFKLTHIPFLGELPKHPMGGWTLLDATTIIYSTNTTSKFPLGKIEFDENKTEPPSRAYLKLWEFFTLHAAPPEKKDSVIDMGSSPGGWSWVLATLNCKVTSVDKAPLADNIERMPQITFIQESAFGFDPAKAGDITWFFSDIICYPERLLELIKRWIEHSKVKHFVCTIKFQGKADFAIIDEFLKIPNSKIVHLYNNKHEVMWWTDLSKE